SIPALTEAARDSDAQVRRLAVALLDRPGRKRRAALGTLGKALSDRDARVRWTAAFVLEELRPRDREVVVKLRRRLRDEDTAVRRRVLFALRALGAGARPAVAAVRDRMTAPGERSLEDQELRADAAAALLRIADDPVALFADVLKTPDDAPGHDSATEAL